jgi:hypothetical protein
MIKHCIECGSKLKEGYKHCRDCGSKILEEFPEVINYCPECGTKIRENYRFCENCGFMIPKKTEKFNEKQQNKEVIKEKQDIKRDEFNDTRKNFCPNCGFNLGKYKGETGILLIGGILSIISAVIFLESIIFAWFLNFNLFEFLILSLFSILGFLASLFSGTLCILKSRYRIVLIGIVLMFMGACIDIIIGLSYDYRFTTIGLIILLLSMICTILIVKYKDEFIN